MTMLGRRRRPLLRGAAVGAAGYAIGKRAERDNQEDAYDEGYADAADDSESAGISDATMEQLRKLGKLKDDGILTQDEFDEQKRILLGSA